MRGLYPVRESVPAHLRNRLLSETEILEQLDGEHLFDDTFGHPGLKHMIGPNLRRAAARAELSEAARGAREQILREIGWKPLDLPGCPPEEVEAENRHMQDYLVGWAQGLAAHIDKYDQVQRAARRGPKTIKRR
jgi:hypothetical protein